jgi:hypothetical protein
MPAALRAGHRNKVVDAAIILKTQAYVPGVFQENKMSNPMQMWNDWCALSVQAARLGWEAQGVIALRVMRMATQPAHSQTEARRMVTEKVAALGEAQAVATAASMKGGKSNRVAKKVLGVYGKRVRANRRRLTKA